MGIYDEGLNGFGGLSRMSGTGVKLAPATKSSSFFVFYQQKES